MPKAAGGASQVVIAFESTYDTDPSPVAGILVPFNYPFGLAASRILSPPDNTHLSRRDGAMPFDGDIDVKGSASVPLDLIAVGYWLRALLGAPDTDWHAAYSLENAAAVDKGGGLVGIPIAGHAFVAGELVVIAGTDNYNGNHIVVSKTVNEIVITATYVAETFDTWYCGGPNVYCGTHIYCSAETCRTRLRTHVFTPGATIPSLVVELGFTDIVQYLKYNGVKLDKLAASVGSGGEVVAALDFLGATPTKGAVAYDVNPAALGFTRLTKRHFSLEIGGVAVTIATEAGFEITNNLDGDSFCLGSNVRGAIAEGDCLAKGSVKALFPDLTMYNYAVNGDEKSLKYLWTVGVQYLSILFPEVQFEQKAPTIAKGVVKVDLPWVAYYEDSTEEAIVQATLRNTHAAY